MGLLLPAHFVGAISGNQCTITDPGQLGCVKITSEFDGVSVHDMIDEYDIELLDDYWARALAHRAENTEA